MRMPTRLPLYVFVFAFSGCTQLPTAKFGVIDGVNVIETRQIHYSVGAHYGFRVDYHDTGKPIALREEFRLPGRAPWSDASDKQTLGLGRMSLTRRGRIMKRVNQLGSHTAAPLFIRTFYVEDLEIVRGDPKGEYRINLWLDDKPFKEFHFRVK